MIQLILIAYFAYNLFVAGAMCEYATQEKESRTLIVIGTIVVILFGFILRAIIKLINLKQKDVRK